MGKNEGYESEGESFYGVGSVRGTTCFGHNLLSALYSALGRLQEQGGGILDKVNAGTMLANAAVGFTNTKPGKLLSMGGAYVYQTMPKVQQIAAVREAQLAGGLTKTFVKGVSILNIVTTGTSVYNDYNDGNYKSALARIAVWGAATVATKSPYVGFGISFGIGFANAIYGEEFYRNVQEYKF